MTAIIHEKNEHVWVPIPGLEHFPQRLCACGAIKGTGIQAGENTITLNSSNQAVWSATPTLTAAGQFGLDVTTGRPLAFVGGASKSIAHTDDTTTGGFKFVAKQTLVAAAQTITQSSLDGNTDLMYYFVLRWLGAAGSAGNIDAQCNSSATNMASNTSRHQAAATTVTDSNVVGRCADTINISSFGVGYLLFSASNANTSRRVGIANFSSVNGATGRQAWHSHVVWTDTATNLTSMRFDINVVSGFLTGTSLTTYKLAQA